MGRASPESALAMRSTRRAAASIAPPALALVRGREPRRPAKRLRAVTSYKAFKTAASKTRRAS